jgi:hypothetical protein
MRKIRAFRGRAGEWAIDARFDKPIDGGEFLAAMIRGTVPRRRGLPIRRVALAGIGAAHWRPGDATAIPTSAEGRRSDATAEPAADLVIRMVPQEVIQWRDTRVTVVDRPQADRQSWVSLSRPGALRMVWDAEPSLLDPRCVPPVDEQTVNPSGFIARPTLGTAQLAQDGDHWAVRGGGVEPMAIPPSGCVTDVEVAKLRQLRAVSVDWGRHTGPVAAVRTVAGLAAAGVPILTAAVPAWATALGADLIQLLTSVTVDDLADDLRREMHSIRLRRVAMRTHSTRARWRELAAGAGLQTEPRDRISVLLCTMRPANVAFALEQIARQRQVDLEVVLTLHRISKDLPEVRRAVASFHRPLIVVEAPADVPLGEALNRGAAAATGDLLAKWDDDDWYGPDHLADLSLAMEYSSADLVGCPLQQIYLEQIDTTVFRPRGEPERFNERVAGGALLIDRQVFVEIGGFRPVAHGEDTALLAAIQAAGGHYYRTHGLGYLLHRRAAGHTWDFSLEKFRTRASNQWPGFQPTELVEATEIINRPPSGLHAGRGGAE